MRRTIPSTIAALLLAVALLAADPAQLRAADEAPLEPAVTAYGEALELEDRDARLAAFAEAELLFRGAVEARHETDAVANADLWTNLGNAALGAERLGPAIHAYRSALRLDPDHRRAEANLRHARGLLPGWVPRPEEGGALDTFLFWHRRLSPAERSTLAALSFLLAGGLLAFGIARRRVGVRNLAVLPLLGWGALLATSPGFGSAAEEAVIIVESTIGRAADSPRSPSKFGEPLPGGVEVRVLEEREGWRRIGLADGREAWVPTSSVAHLGAFTRP